MHHHLTEKRVAVLADNFYEDTELWVPFYRLMEEGAQVDVVAATIARVEAEHGQITMASRPAVPLAGVAPISSSP